MTRESAKQIWQAAHLQAERKRDEENRNSMRGLWREMKNIFAHSEPVFPVFPMDFVVGTDFGSPRTIEETGLVPDRYRR